MDDPKFQVGNYVKVNLQTRDYTGLVVGVQRQDRMRRREPTPFTTIEHAMARYVYTVECDHCGHVDEWSEQRLQALDEQGAGGPKCEVGKTYIFYPNVWSDPLKGEVVKIHRTQFRWCYDMNTKDGFYPGVAEELIVCH